MHEEIKSVEFAIPKTLSQSIYNHLKNLILTNKLKTSQKINEKEIANLFQVSTTPVREAIIMLGAEGFVNIKSHKEVVVKELSVEELREIFEVLSNLETLAIKLATDNLKTEDLKELEDLYKEMVRYCHIDSVEKYCELHLAFHARIWDAIKNSFLRKTLLNIKNQILRYNYVRYHSLRKPGALKDSLNKHRAIMKALRVRNIKQLQALMSRHWAKSFLGLCTDEGELKEFLKSK